MINRFEKVVLIILAGLGAGYWGFGLWILLITLGERADNQNLLYFVNRITGIFIFVSLEIGITKNRIQRRRVVWPVFIIATIVAIGLSYLLEGVLAHR